MNKIKVVLILILLMTLLPIVSCAGKTVTTTINNYTTVTKTGSTITQTLPVSTITSTVTSLVTSTKTLTTTPSTSTSASTSTTNTTSSQTVTTTEYTIVDGKITSLDGKLQIISHRMDYGTRPGIRAKISNLSTSIVDAELIIEVIHPSYTEQLTEVILDLEPGETRDFSVAITGYYDTSYNFLVLRVIP